MHVAEAVVPPHSTSPASRLRFTALKAPAVAHEVDFGVEVSPGDVGRLSDADFAALERAVYTHQVVVVRGQNALSPAAQFELTRRFDPTVKTYGHGNREELLRASVLTRDLISIPDVPQVKLLGNGPVSGHEGLPDVELRHPSHQDFHHTPLTPMLEAQDFARFYRWHIDAALYDYHPPKVTTLLALKVPKSRTQRVLYDDGSGDELDVSLGTTAFISGYTAFEKLSEAQRAFALQTQVRYAPHPYIWMKRARSLGNGLGLVCEGRELRRDELPEVDEARIMTLPLVWTDPTSGRHALQVHAYCVEDLIVDGEPVGDLGETRRLLYELMRPAIAPSRVYAHPWQSGDLVIFHNRGVWHSVVGSLRQTDLRVYHQCNLASNDAPALRLS
jgi:alpha-ketoglutarate-dependent taurine dioxygenase